MSTDLAISGYEGRIGRYGPELAEAFTAMTGVAAGERLLDVGCGTGRLTVRLAELVGAGNVWGIDPDTDAVAVCRERVPGADVRVGRAEVLPFPADSFDAVLAQLVFTMVDNAEQVASEMRRVTRPGGRVAACVWDFAEGMTALRAFWDAAAAIAPQAREHDQAHTRPYASREDLDALWRATGLHDVVSGELVAGAGYTGFDDLWEPLAMPDGGPGPFLESIDLQTREAIREELRRRLGSPEGPFRLEARAWYVMGRA